MKYLLRLFASFMFWIFFFPASASDLPFQYFSAHEPNLDQFVLYTSTVRVTRDFRGENGTLAIIAKNKSFILDIYYICSKSSCTRTAFNIRERLSFGSFVTNMQPTSQISGCAPRIPAEATIRLFAVDIQDSVKKMLPSGNIECDGASKDNIAIAYKNFLNLDTEAAVKTCIEKAHPSNQLFFDGLKNLRANQTTSPSFTFACNYGANAPRIAELGVPENCVVAKAPLPLDPCINVPLIAHEYSHFVDLKLPDSVAVAVENCYSEAFQCPRETKSLGGVVASTNGIVDNAMFAKIDTKIDRIIPADGSNFDHTGTSAPLSIWNQAMGLITRAEGSVHRQYGENPLGRIGNNPNLTSNSDLEIKKPSAVNYLPSGEAVGNTRNELDARPTLRANINAADIEVTITGRALAAKALATDATKTGIATSEYQKDSLSKSSAIKVPARQIASVSNKTYIKSSPTDFLKKIESALAKAKTKLEFDRLSDQMKREGITVRLNRRNAELWGSKILGDETSAKQKLLQDELGKVEIIAR